MLSGERPAPAVEFFGLHGVTDFGDTALPVLFFFLLSRASIQHKDNWARVDSNNSFYAEPRVITPFDP